MNDVRPAMTAAEAEQYARHTLDLVRGQFPDDVPQPALTDEFLVPTGDAHGSHVGRDATHGLGVTTPWWSDPGVAGDIDYCDGWVTVYDDGTVD